MRRTCLCHKISLLPLQKNILLQIALFKCFANKNSYRFYFAVIIFAFDRICSLYTVACVECFSYISSTFV
jgi:hypothetical protein